MTVKSLNIAHVSTPKSWRGGEQQLAYLFAELLKLNQNQILIVNKNSELSNYAKANNWEYFGLNIRSSISLSFAKNIARICKEKNISILHPHDSKAHTQCILAHVFFNCKTPIILSRRVDYPISKSFFSKYKYNHPAIKAIICVSDAIKKIMQKDIINKNILCTVYDGIDINKFHFKKSNQIRNEFNIKDDELLIANIAAISEQKDYFTFVNTAELLLNSGIKAKFIVFGDGPLKEKIIEFVKQKKLIDSILFAGFRNNIPEILPQIDYLLFSSQNEGLGSSILDAFCSKVPVVATEIGGIPELIKHKETGLLAPVKNPKLLAEQIKFYINNPGIKNEIIENAFLFSRNFTYQKMAEETLKVYLS